MASATSSVDAPADGVRILYDVTAGEHPDRIPVVLLHGSVLSRAIWRGLGYLAPLAAERPVVRIDLRGHGRSGAPHEAAAYTQEKLAADVMTVLADAGIDRAAVLGYSLGARVALTLALTHPGRITGIVALGGSASVQDGAVEQVFFPGALEALRTEGMEGFCTGQGLGPDVTRRRDVATRQAFLAADPAAMLALFTATGATPGIADEALRACEVPALWMTGDRDVPRFEESRRAAGLMPRGRFVPLPGRSHGGTLHPADEVLAAVLPFLRELDAG